MKKRTIGTTSIQARVFISGIILTLLVCIPGCNNKSNWLASTIPSSTGTATRLTNKSPSATGSIQTSGSNPRTIIPKTSTKTTVPAVKKTISDMLKTIPAVSALHNDVWFVDFAALRKVHDISLENYRDAYENINIGGENKYIIDVFLHPEDEATGSMHGLAPFISGIGIFLPYILQSPIREESIGYSPLDVEQSIFADVWLPNENGYVEYEAINGSFDIKAIYEATSKYEDIYARPQISKYNDIDIYSWSGETRLSARYQPPIFDNLGRGRTLAIQPNEIFGSKQIEYVEQMVDVSQGQMKSLADNPKFLQIAQALESMVANSMIMTDEVLKPDNYLDNPNILSSSETAEMYKNLFEKADDDAPVMGPYSASASGLGKDDQGLYVTLALIYDSNEKANSEIAVLKKRITTSKTIEGKPYWEEVDSLDVWADDTALCAKLRGNVVNYWGGLIWSETLLVRAD